MGWVPGSTLPVGAKIVEKAEKKSSGLGFVKVACFLWGRTGAKFAEPTPGKGNGKGRRLVRESGLSAKGPGVPAQSNEVRLCGVGWCNQAPGSTLVRKEIHGVTRAFALARIVPGKLPGSSAHLVC